ncbi:Uncharacterised protein [Serratia marcescens]|nr:Uncharacterised protein [Serratia marcescens]CVC28156.1 Uncharacterised protein [Serratia marcescens]CVD62484.1 Uncharacterised protein [Serratia marcescens]CVH26339.1 Uncharacterised protein [Serratia marcescens]
MLTEDDSPGASLATRITRICSGGTTAKVAAPQITMLTAAPMSLRASSGISSMMATNSSRKPFSVALSERSANLPPR